LTPPPQRRTPPPVKDETPKPHAAETPGETPRGKAARDARLASALRANLLRRKAAQRTADQKDEG
jgi:hypothetical protein